MTGIHEEYHATHALEAALDRRLARMREHEAEIRRLTEERWQRRIDPLLPVSRTEYDPDFHGCVL